MRYKFYSLYLVFALGAFGFALPAESQSLVASKGRYNSHARVFGLKYAKLNRSQGIFKGRVRGNGYTKLYLAFIQRGKIIRQQLIGKVLLEREPQGVNFSYRSSIPRGSGLSWKIIAIPASIT